MVYNRGMDAIRDSKGKWITRPPDSAPILDSTRASELNRLRWDMYTDAARVAVIKACEDMGIQVTDAAGAYGVAVAAQYKALVSSQKPKFSDLIKFRDILLGKDSAQDGDNSQRENIRAGEISAAPAVLMELVAMIEQRQRQAADRARAVDASSQDVLE